MIPVAFIANLVEERYDRKREVVAEVSNKWASSQSLFGPVLMIPYDKEVVKEIDGKQVTAVERCTLVLLPDSLAITGTVDPHTRHRSIFDVTVYQAGLRFEGSFAPADLSRLDVTEKDLIFNETQMFFTLTDFRGIEKQLTVEWDGASYEMTTESAGISLDEEGLYTPVAYSAADLKRGHHFSFALDLKGSEDLKFTPLGKNNRTEISSPWSNPSFIGGFLPNNPAEINAGGFRARWEVVNLNRSYPQVWVDRMYSVETSQYGVNLLESTDSYAKTERSVKYAILFIALTMALYFFVEILQKRRVHLMQYALVGLALSIYYTLLLSLSEYMPFNAAYAIASLATIAMIGIYTATAFRSRKTGWIFALVLGLLYTFIFTLVQLQDRALLFGSIGLFALLAIIMYLSRKIEWYGNDN